MLHAFLLVSVFLFHSASAADRELIIFNWPSYLAPELILSFEQQWNVVIKEVYYESDDERSHLLSGLNGKGFDILISSDDTNELYVRAGWVDELDRAKLPNIKYISDSEFSANPMLKGYAIIPYFSGSTGILYRKDLVANPVTSWRQLFEPEEQLKGKVLMINDTQEMIYLAMITLGYEARDYNNPEALKAVEKLLIHQNKYVDDYSYFSLEEDQSRLAKGEIAMSYSYSGDSEVVKNFHPEIEFIVPKEGCILWQDSMLIAKQSKNKDLAYAFVNFINEPRNAKINSIYTRLPSLHERTTNSSPPMRVPVPGAEKTLHITENCSFLPKLAARTRKSWNHLYSKIRAVGDH